MRYHIKPGARFWWIAGCLALPLATLAQEQPRLRHPIEKVDGEFAQVEKVPEPQNVDEVKQIIGYPKAARVQQIQGKVVVQILVDRQGQSVKHLILRSPHPLLTEAVVAALPKLKWTPALQKQKPIMCWVTLPINFQLPVAAAQQD